MVALYSQAVSGSIVPWTVESATDRAVGTAGCHVVIPTLGAACAAGAAGSVVAFRRHVAVYASRMSVVAVEVWSLMEAGRRCDLYPR